MAEITVVQHLREWKPSVLQHYLIQNGILLTINFDCNDGESVGIRYCKNVRCQHALAIIVVRESGSKHQMLKLSYQDNYMAHRRRHTLAKTRANSTTLGTMCRSTDIVPMQKLCIASTIVLNWLQGNPQGVRWQAQIMERWRHVLSAACQRTHYGLRFSQVRWLTVKPSLPSVGSFVCVEKQNLLAVDGLFHRLIRITAWTLRFFTNSKIKSKFKSQRTSLRSGIKPSHQLLVSRRAPIILPQNTTDYFMVVISWISFSHWLRHVAKPRPQVMGQLLFSITWPDETRLHSQTGHCKGIHLYICVAVCRSVRSEACLRRFISRRGKPVE